MPITDLLRAEHPTYAANKEHWRRSERRIRGGRAVIERELQRFLWETEGGESHRARMAQAVYPNFGLGYLLTMYGHILREAPKPENGLSLGGLGNVARDEDQTVPSRAEQVFYNVDGVGGDGSHFYSWLLGVLVRAGGTGHRWVSVEAPETAPSTRADELRGLRPYAVEESPLAVPNWHFERGQLQFRVVRHTARRVRVEAGRLVGNDTENRFTVQVRRGYTDLDSPGYPFSDGGEWTFDKDGNLIGEPRYWDRTGGEIPAVVFYHLQDPDDDEDFPAMSKAGAESLSNLSVLYMNQQSARASNAWRAAADMVFMLGADAESYALAKTTWENGSIFVPVPPTREGNIPQIQNAATGAISAEIFTKLTDDIVAEAERQALQQITHTPNSSGRSKQVGFLDQKGPMLAVLAENTESAVNTLLRFFEMRFGVPRPTAEIKLPREYDLKPVEEDLAEFFATFRDTGLRSATLETKAALMLAEAKRLISDDTEREAIQAELMASVQAAQARTFQAGAETDAIADALRGAREPGTAAEDA